MKILFWVPYPTEGASNRYRIEQYLPYLKSFKIEYELHPFWNTLAFKVLYKKKYFLRKASFFLLGTVWRIFDLLQLYKYDIVFIHREAYPLGPALLESIIALLKKPFIFDFDDAVFLPASSPTNSFIEKFRSPRKTVKIIKMSSLVIAGNRYLADYSLKLNPSVVIIPTPIDTEKYLPRNNKNINGKTVVGWVGSATTIEFLKILQEVFRSLSMEFRDIVFKIIGGEFKIDGVSNIISKPWSMEDELDDLSYFDIGVMPMPDNAWTRGKCGFKAILYMSLGIPCVCSPVGINKEIIHDGQNGFLALTQQEWLDKLTLLIGDSKLRKRIGIEARKTIEEKFSLKVNAPKFLETIKTVYSESRIVKIS